MKLTTRLIQRFSNLSLAGEILTVLRSEYGGAVTLVESTKGSELRCPIGTSTATYAAIRGYCLGYQAARRLFHEDSPENVLVGVGF